MKVRVAGAEDPDYIEVEMPGDSLTLEYLAVVAAEELGVETSQVERIRKMPNTKLRRDKEVLDKNRPYQTNPDPSNK